MTSKELKTVNQEIFEYWCSRKPFVLRKRLHKKRVGTFNRPNSRTKICLKKTWRYNNGIRSHEIKRPSIGYKRPPNLRFRRAADGLLFKIITSHKQITDEDKLKPYEVYTVASAVSARARKKILDLVKSKSLPLYIQRPKNFKKV